MPTHEIDEEKVFKKFGIVMIFDCFTLVTGFRKYTEIVQISGERLYNRIAMLWRPSCRCLCQALVSLDSLFLQNGLEIILCV